MEQSVWILTTVYKSGKVEVNGVFSTEEKAINMKEWMNNQCEDIMGKTYKEVIKEQKIQNYIIL